MHEAVTFVHLNSIKTIFSVLESNNENYIGGSTKKSILLREKGPNANRIDNSGKRANFNVINMTPTFSTLYIKT